MAVQTGRTVSKFVRFLVDDSGGTPREIPVSTINGVGLPYEEVDVTAFQDAVKGTLSNQPDCTIEVSGPWDSTAVAAAAASAAAPVLSGSHAVLYNLAGAYTPLGLCICFGVRHYWEAGEPVFGIVTATAANGFVCTAYNVSPNDMTYSATFKVYPGSAAPAWGTAILT